jgi:hypothetical protein
MRCDHVARSLLALTLAIACLATAPLLSAADAPAAAKQKVQAHIAAGEFGPAMQAASKLPAKERDAALAQIAARQAQAGARQGSLSTLSSIASSDARSAAANDLRSSPFLPHVGGGGVIADFDTLIDLITSTIAPDSWTDNGGSGSISGFPTGVLVDGRGVMSRAAADASGAALLRRTALTASKNRNPHVTSSLRKVSLPRLEQALQLRYAQGLSPTDAMRNLAGLTRVQYVFVYEDTGEIVLAGPAGDWATSEEGRVVSVEKGQAVVQLDDLVVVLRNALGKGTFGCAITPTRENLEASQTYLAETGKKPLAPGKSARDKWLAGLREKLGLQDIEVHGIDPRSHAGRTIVEADYHMKLVGMGLEKGVLGVESYLDSMTLKPGEAAPAMGVLRWWFTLGDGAIRVAEDRNAFELTGAPVKVLSENELLTARGERIHTGKSDELNARFADSFTKHFDALAAKYPVYAELRNVFDLAVVAAMLKQEHVLDRTGWQASHLLDAQKYQIELAAAPEKVMSVANYRIINERTLVAGVSGGVEVDAAAKLQSNRYKVDNYGDLEAGRRQSVKANLANDLWWWD